MVAIATKHFCGQRALLFCEYLMSICVKIIKDLILLNNENT